MQILFLVSAHNRLSQRAWVALAELGHEVAVAVVDSAAAMAAAVRAHPPDLIVCPFLKPLMTASTKPVFSTDSVRARRTSCPASSAVTGLARAARRCAGQREQPAERGCRECDPWGGWARLTGRPIISAH